MSTHGQAKVTNARIVCHVYEDIIRFQIPVNDTVAVNMAETVQNLTEQTPAAINIVIKAIVNQISQSLAIVRARFRYLLSRLLTCFSQYSIWIYSVFVTCRSCDPDCTRPISLPMSVLLATKSFEARIARSEEVLPSSSESKPNSTLGYPLELM